MSGHNADVHGGMPPYAGTGDGSARDNARFPRFRGTWQGSDEFDATEIVVDPQLPAAVRYELREAHVPVAQGTVRPRPAVPVRAPRLVRFRDQRPAAPPPPRSQAPAAVLLTVAGVLFVASITAAIAVSPALFGLLAVLALGAGGVGLAARRAAKDGRPAILGGLLWLPETADLTGYYVTNAGTLFHRRYVRPEIDLDEAAQTAWRRTVEAANRVYRSESFRGKAIDTDRVTAEVPEVLWGIAEGLAKISDARFDQRRIVAGTGSHPAVEAKVRDQERLLARGIGQVDRRIGKLETLAARLDAADAARQGEAVLRELLAVDPKILDVLASTDESTGGSELAASVQLDVESVIQMANQAISELSVADEQGSDAGQNDNSRGPGLPDDGRPQATGQSLRVRAMLDVRFADPAKSGSRRWAVMVAWMAARS